MLITFFDTETTDLLLPITADPLLQPRITEIYLAQVDDKKYKMKNEYHTILDPGIPIPHFITRLTGIDDYTVAGKPKFTRKIARKIQKLFDGSEMVVAHNLTFDLGMLDSELARLPGNKKFKYPKKHFCTIEQSMHLKGIRLKSTELYEIATGKTEIKGVHRAKADVMAMIESFKFLRGDNDAIKLD